MCMVVYNGWSVYECVHNQLVFVYMVVYSTSRCLYVWLCTMGVLCMNVYIINWCLCIWLCIVRVGVCVSGCVQ